MVGKRTVGIRVGWMMMAAAALLLVGCDSQAGPYTNEPGRGSSTQLSSTADTDAPSTDHASTASTGAASNGSTSNGNASNGAASNGAATGAGADAADPNAPRAAACPTDGPAVAAAIATAAPENSGVVLATSPECTGFRWILLSTGATGPNAAPSAPQAPRHVLLFDGDTYLGPVGPTPLPYTDVIGHTADTIFVRYRWAQPSDDPSTPTGGPVVVRYQQAGGGVVALDQVPSQPSEVSAEAVAAGCSNVVDAQSIATAIATLPPSPSGPWQPARAIVGCQELGWAVVTSPAGPTVPALSHVLFFADGRYVGTATNDPVVEPAVQGNPTSDTVTVDYDARNPSGAATVDYRWDGVRLLTLDRLAG